MQDNKGLKFGKCNRTACATVGINVVWKHKDNEKFYCSDCALAIMRWPENANLLEVERFEGKCPKCGHAHSYLTRGIKACLWGGCNGEINL